MPPADPLPSLSSAEWQSEAEVTDEENAAQAVVSEIGNTTPPEPEVGCESQRKSKKLLVCNIWGKIKQWKRTPPSSFGTWNSIFLLLWLSKMQFLSSLVVRGSASINDRPLQSLRPHLRIGCKHWFCRKWFEKDPEENISDVRIVRRSLSPFRRFLWRPLPRQHDWINCLF